MFDAGGKKKQAISPKKGDGELKLPRIDRKKIASQQSQASHPSSPDKKNRQSQIGQAQQALRNIGSILNTQPKHSESQPHGDEDDKYTSDEGSIAGTTDKLAKKKINNKQTSRYNKNFVLDPKKPGQPLINTFNKMA